MELKDLIKIFIDFCLWIINCIEYVINNDIFKSFMGVFIGGFLSSNISKKQVRDNNNFVVLTQIKNEIMQNVDKSHNNINDFIMILNKMSETLFTIKNQEDEFEKRFIMLNLLTELTNIINSSRSCNNYILSNIELLKSIYGVNIQFILNFEKDYLSNSITCINYLEEKSKNIVDLMTKRGKNEIGLKKFIDNIGTVMIEISRNSLIKNFMTANAANIIEFINTETSILISENKQFKFNKRKSNSSQK